MESTAILRKPIPMNVDKKRKEVMDLLTATEFDPTLFDQKVAEAVKKIASNLEQQNRIMLSELIKRRHGPPPPPPHSGWDNWDNGPDKGPGGSGGDN